MSKDTKHNFKKVPRKVNRNPDLVSRRFVTSLFVSSIRAPAQVICIYPLGCSILIPLCFNGFQFVCVKPASIGCHPSYLISIVSCVYNKRNSVFSSDPISIRMPNSGSLFSNLFSFLYSRRRGCFICRTARALPHNWRSNRLFSPPSFTLLFVLFLRSFSPSFVPSRALYLYI